MPDPITFTKAEMPELPDDVTITFLSGRPNQAAVDAIMESVEKFLVRERVENGVETSKTA